MSDMTLFEGMGSMPAHLQGGELSDTAKALAGGSAGQSLKRISFKGSVFRMMVGAQEVAQNEDRAMNMIVVKSAPAIARTYYEGTYKDGQVSSPACWSDDGNAPSPNVENPQASLCANCPQNVQGSAAQGGGRACRYSARLAVVLEGDPKGDVYGVTLAATSVFGKAEDGSKYAPLQAYVRRLAEFGADIIKVVTEVKFDTKSPVPKLMFRAIRALNEEEWATVQRKAESPDAKAHTGPRQFTKREDEETLKANDGFEKPKAAAEEPKVVKKKAEPVQAEKADVASILDEWGDE